MEVRSILSQVDRRPESVRCPGETVAGVRRLLVVRHDRLGDLVVTLPAVAALRRTYPRARLGMAVSPSFETLARMVEGVDEIVPLPAHGPEIAARLAAWRPDLLICVTRGAALAVAAARAGIAQRVGTGRRFYSPLFHRRIDEPRRHGGRHEVEYALSFAHRVGASGGPASFPLRLPEGPRTAAARWRQSASVGGRFVVLHPGSGGSCPRWPVRHFQRLAEMLRAAGVHVVVSIGPDDEDVRRALAGTAAGPPRFAGPLPDLAALLRDAALVVSNSTGPIHLAAALDTPTLALHAPWPTCGVARWGPYSAKGWGLVADYPGAATWSGRERRQRAAELMAAVSPSLVRDRVLERLAPPD